jgi:hypothetical protein
MKTLQLLALLWITGPALAQWEFQQSDNGQVTSNMQLSFPVTYDEANCEFTFTANQNGEINNITISNPLGCGNPHYLVLDDHQYLLPDGFSVTMNDVQYVFSGVVNLGPCSRLSELPISSGFPDVQINGESYKIDIQSQQVFYTRQGATWFQFDSFDDDIVCASGEPFVHPDDLIFRGGFQ